jgi:hypothetical protein
VPFVGKRFVEHHTLILEAGLKSSDTRRQTMSEYVLTVPQCEELCDLFRITPFDPRGRGKKTGPFRYLVGLALKPDAVDGKKRFKLLRPKLEKEGFQFMTIDAKEGIYVGHCPGHPCAYGCKQLEL